MLPPIPLTPLSWGEVIDKITILEIKRAVLARKLGERRARLTAAVVNFDARQVYSDSRDRIARGIRDPSLDGTLRSQPNDHRR